jgi:ABC-type multidrug transport system fused ATPase/permease subunit
MLQGTVADNIRFFRSLDDAQVERAARLAHIHDDIAAWPSRYQTLVGQRELSGGERQRICLARALAGNPSVLVLDEPTSSLDPRSESLVQESLAQLSDQLTLFIIAHRFSTLRHCDRTIVMRDGRLQAFGPPEELVQTNEFYRKALSLSDPTQTHDLAASLAAKKSSA